ncbi:MAG: reverse gyrase [Conexivisphaera sp.]
MEELSPRLEEEVGRRALYLEMCPNCGSHISDARLEVGLPCTACYPSPSEAVLGARDPASRIREVIAELARARALRRYGRAFRTLSRLEEFNGFFRRATGYDLWTVQRTWASRALSGQSFAIVSPTGTGKTVFGIILSLYHVARLRRRSSRLGEKAYLVFPSSFLVQQARDKLEAFASRLGIRARVLAYTGSDREDFARRLESGDFDILLTTNQYLSRNFDSISRSSFGLVFVDDVDAILRASRNIDRVLALIGFTQEDVAAAYELVRARREYARALSARDEEAARAAQSRISELQASVRRARRRVRGVLLLSSATARPKGTRVRLFRELLGFEVGRQSEMLRNIADVYAVPAGPVEDAVVDYVRRLGPGGLVFVPTDAGLESAERLAGRLSAAGVRAASTATRDRSLLERFARGEYDVLVGVASYYGKLVRGLDLPERIRYALFAGVPRFRYRIDERTYNPVQLVQMLTEVRRVVQRGRGAAELDRAIDALSHYLRVMPWPAIRRAIEEVRAGTAPDRGLPKYLRRASELAARYYSNEEILRRISEGGRVVVRSEGGVRYLLVPDVLSYLQASGRASRLFAGGISRGLALTLVDDEQLMRALERQGRTRYEIEWKPVEEVDLGSIMEEVDRDRRMIRSLMEGRLPPEMRSPMRSALLLVESPTKARTIASFFGRPAVRVVGEGFRVYEVATGGLLLSVAATRGHMFDLVTDSAPPTPDGSRNFHGVLSLDDSKFVPVYGPIKRCLKCGTTFVGGDRCPRCGSRRVLSSRSTVDAILSIAPEYDLVLLGTDPDAEGEKIAWDLRNMLVGFVPEVRRIEFHEVTRWALERALESPRDVNERLVEAQLVRRVEDRWIGFELSERLRAEFAKRVRDRHGLSAGRVQTPVLGWIVRRADEYLRSWRKMLVIVIGNSMSIVVREDEANLDEVKRAVDSSGVRVASVRSEERELNPPPPFTTDTLLAEATRYLRTSVDHVMRLAQDLFEAGLITYHRTDSTYVSDKGLSVAREYITENFGPGAYHPRKWGSPGAHECIRPTRPLDLPGLSEALKFSPISARLTDAHMSLYSLIFNRFMASQMPPARVSWRTVELELGPVRKSLEGAAGYPERGFTAVYQPRVQEAPPFGPGEIIRPSFSVVKYGPTIYLYRQGDVISMMRERGIGRPSTYAKILQTLLERRYVYQGPGGGLTPSKKGIMVYEYLSSKFRDVISEERTRQLEEKMDRVERGEVNYQSLLRELYAEICSLPR